MNGTVVISGKAHFLRFTVNHLCCAEEAAVQPLHALMNGSFLGIRAILWCGLMDEKITLEEAGEMLQAYLQQGGTLKQLSEILANALCDAGFFHCPVQETGEAPSA